MVLKRLIDAVRRKRGEMWTDRSLILHEDEPTHSLLQVTQFSAGRGISAMIIRRTLLTSL
jgi:hypothetical protein